MERIRLRDRVTFQDGKMAKIGLAGTSRCQADLSCLSPGQSEAVHAHAAGPSRAADIALNLTRGFRGPEEAHALFVDSR